MSAGTSECLKSILHAEAATKDNLLFDMLPMQSKQAIFNSMTPLECPEGTDIIVQGDKDARTFYVLESGSCDVYINMGKDPADGLKKVHQYAAARCADAQMNTSVVVVMLMFNTLCNTLSA